MARPSRATTRCFNEARALSAGSSLWIDEAHRLHHRFNEARALSAGSCTSRAPMPRRRPRFNEARALSAGSYEGGLGPAGRSLGLQ